MGKKVAKILAILIISVAPAFFVKSYYVGKQRGLCHRMGRLEKMVADMEARVGAVAVHNLELYSIIRLQDNALREFTMKEQARIRRTLGGREAWE